jgi:putative ABC transport system permease protein
VTRAAFSADLPFDGNERVDAIVTPDDLGQSLGEAARTLRVFSGAAYLTTLGVDFLRGRDFEPLDFADYPRVVVVNDAFAQERWPDKDPIGQRLAQRHDEMSLEDDLWYTVVGVVANVRERSLVRPPEPTVYLPSVFLPDSDYAMFVENQTLLVQTSAAPHDIVPAVRETIRSMDSDILVDGIRSVDQLTAASMQQVTFAMVLVILSAGVALMLGIVGIYGAVAYTVGQRTREFGVRIALGATAHDIRNSVLRQGSGIGLMGIVLGLAGATIVSRVLQSMLYGVSAFDVPTYSVVSLGLFALVLVAGLVPALRATRVDPVRAIGGE